MHLYLVCQPNHIPVVLPYGSKLTFESELRWTRYKNENKVHNVQSDLTANTNPTCWFSAVYTEENQYQLQMCSVSTNGVRASPAQGFQLIGCHFS